MNDFIHTLTAYHIVFSYMKRNNPLKEELSEAIKNDEKPQISIEEVLQEMVQITNDGNYDELSIGSRIIVLENLDNVELTKFDFTRIYIVPKSGRRDIQTSMIRVKNGRKNYNFGNDWASTYPNNIFFYEKDDEFYCVFHRHGGSGCKTILLSVLNNILKKKGIKVEMNWMPPFAEKENADYDIDGISLIYEEEIPSDIADVPDKKKRKIKIKELTLNLKQGNLKIRDILKRYRLKEITKEEAFSEISKEERADGYNNAMVIVNVGKTRKKVSWDDLEGLIDGFDITDKMMDSSGNFIDKLKECSDDFLFTLIGDDIKCH